MTRHEAASYARAELTKHGLTDWTVRFNQNSDSRFLGLCSYRDKCIILSVHHIDIHPTPDVINTIKHEVAHAIVGPGNGHNEMWSSKAREIGCDNTSPCSNLSLSPDVIDAIRSGATVEVTFDEQIIRTPKYTITRLQDKCPYCGKVAKSVNETTIVNPSDTRPDLKVIKLECGHTLTKSIPKGTPFHLFQFGGRTDCTHEWNKNQCTKCGRYKPYDFQLASMKFIEAALSVNQGGAVFHEMGLGKTIIAGGVIYYHPEWQPCLWIVKSGLKYQFAMFILNWMGDAHVPQIIEKSSDICIPGLKHYIIGYDMLVPKERKLKSGTIAKQGFDITKFEKAGIKCVVLDECQQIKNVDSTRTQMVRRVVKGRKVIPLSGTPWKNRGTELFPVLNMMDPMRFNSEERFKREWVKTYWEGKYLRVGGINRPAKFKEYTKDMLIRYERTEVMKELPLVNRTKLYVTMTPTEEGVYDEAVEQFVKWYQEQQVSISSMNILGAMQRMRHLVAQAKMPTTIEYADEFLENNERKLVIFVHHKDVGETILDELKERAKGKEWMERFGHEVPILKLTADMSGEERFQMQQKFNETKLCVLIASTLAAGEGLNLQTCADCIIHERQWNPANEEQAEGRFIRIGQTSESVNAVYAHMEGLTSIDPTLDVINERKRAWFHEAHNNSELKGWSQESMARELADAIVLGYNRKKGKAA